MNKNKFWPKDIWPNDNIAEITTYMGSYSMLGYAYGFLEIASIASEEAIENKCAIDTIMAAILYNIRHSVELFLKSVLSEISEKSGQNLTAEDHKIKVTFKEYKDQIVMFLETEYHTGSFAYKEWVNGFESIINIVDEFDSDGQISRFPTNKKGKPHFGGKGIVIANDVFCLIKYIQSYFDEYDKRDT